MENRLLLASERQEVSLRRVLRWSRRLGRQVVFVSNADFLTERARCKYSLENLDPHYLPNPIPMPEIRGISYDSKPMILSLGRLDPQKRPWIIFELAGRMPDIDFIVAGETRFKKLMEPVIARYIHLPNLKMVGVTVGDQKIELLQRCWGLLNTSLHEGLPVSFLEAFSYGKCVISCQNPGGLVDRFGYFVGEIQGSGLDDRSIEPFIAKIRECVQGEELRRKKGRSARKYVEREHNFTLFRCRLQSILEREGLIRD